MNGLILAGLLISTVGAPLYGANSDSKVVVDIAKSSVGVDLKALLNDETPFDNLPSLSTSSSNNFRYLGSVPSNGSIYVYFVSNSDLSSLSADVGTSLNADYSITKNIQSYSPILVNSYTNGSYVFYKKVISGAYTYLVGNQHRFDVVKVGAYICDDDLSWEDTASGTDRIYEYYKDNYVVINSKVCALDCVPYFDSANKVSGNYSDSFTYPNAAKELFYCFFSLDETSSTRSIDNCVAVDYGYTSYQYDYYYRATHSQPSGATYCGVYLGTDSIYEPIYWMSDSSKDAQTVYERGVVDDSLTENIYSGNKHVEPGSFSIKEEQSSSSLFGWMKGVYQVRYTYSSLVKLDSNSIDSLTDESFKGFIDRNKGSYNFAFLISSSVREVTKKEYSYNNPIDAINAVGKVTTSCNGVSQIQIFRLTFKENKDTFNLNAIDEPTDVTIVDPAYDAQVVYIPPVGWNFDGLSLFDKFLKWLTEFGTKLGIGLACTIGLIGVIWVTFKFISIKTQSVSISRSLAKREKKKD